MKKMCSIAVTKKAKEQSYQDINRDKIVKSEFEQKPEMMEAGHRRSGQKQQQGDLKTTGVQNWKDIVQGPGNIKGCSV